ncbi:hypothetical protein NITGR_740017 [Nitrospina gracilis 3/211]|uniref:Uncharacterized protein n=1 Tax=Nitrospina gracilis (strain 3/211) TaxID=1266370 RepID=M1ZDQ3_NITG3|nr:MULTISPECIES: hypothetical protein [Nitrospina]MCF8724463.1 hypothetical protein [Nitrospina sp. Nb-3]CCQ91625.1 hypothetical protein NITGR_740017 [Nitrospina gracilis 3/211]
MDKIKLKVGDHLYEPLSRNNGEVREIISHPDGKLVRVRWRVDDFPPHDTEHFHKKLLKSIRNGEIQYRSVENP